MIGVAAVFLLSQGSISTDPRFSERVPFDSALCPLDNFIGIARVATGVPLAIDPTLSNLKVDAFVDDQPIGVTLAKLSEVFNLQWQLDGNGYRLVPNKVNMDQTAAYLASEDSQVVKVVDQDIEVYREIDRLVPKSEKLWPRRVNRFASWIPRKEAAEEELNRAKENNESPEKLAALQTRFEALKQISGGSPNLQLARLIGQMSIRDIADMRNGSAYFASNDNRARFHYSLGDIKPNDGMPPSQAVRSVIIARADPDSHRIGYKEMTFVDNQIGMSAEPASHYPFEELTPTLAKQPFAVSLKEWDETNSLEKNLSGPFLPSYDETNGGLSSWYGKRRRLGDHLRWFHQVTSVPVIAQADRTTHPFIRSYRTSKNQGDYISKLVKACKGFSHKSDDFLLVRDGAYWRKETAEIPEHLWAMIERPQGRKLSLLSMGDFASKLSYSQAMQVQDFNAFVVNFQRFRFAEAYPAVRFISCLNADQLSNACDPKQGLSYLEISPDQQKLFAYAVIEGILGRGMISDDMLNTLIYTGVVPQTLNMMKLFLADTSVTATYAAESIMEEGNPVDLLPTTTYKDRPTKNFIFTMPDPRYKLTFSTEDIGL